MSAGMNPAGSPVTVIDGGFSSPDAPRGTGGPKSKYNFEQLMIVWFERENHFGGESGMASMYFGKDSMVSSDMRNPAKSAILRAK